MKCDKCKILQGTVTCVCCPYSEFNSAVNYDEVEFPEERNPGKGCPYLLIDALNAGIDILGQEIERLGNIKKEFYSHP